eukprot:CAMPEP_0176431878 /NCGR_PEP_ID=MMETSP0127-20121128/15060_1 /TAXON_ID=938130 /ORGANISM="Platyophrya macrostoma, Strain WH" /LENGTH=176 /DNA_ID=CAMNT_0017813941 /DNA_START=73 /DNA_END=603 /DNA_ORIENTATION=-
MGNTCASHRGVGTKVSRSSSHMDGAAHGAVEQSLSVPPWAPRNADGVPVEPFGQSNPHGSAFPDVTIHERSGSSKLRLVSVNQVAMYPDVDEGGSPAVDATKSLESINAWLQNLSESDASTDGNLSPDADFNCHTDEAISLPATYDAEEERHAGRVVRAIALRTPLVERHTKKSFF